MAKLPWFRMYSEARNDAKLRVLADDEHRVWFNLLCLASEGEQRGTLDASSPYCLAAEVAHGDEDLLSRTLDKCVKLRIIDTIGDNSMAAFAHWSDRQYDKPSETPERIKERVTRHRQSSSNADVTPPKHPETRGNTLYTDRDTDTDSEGNQNPLTPKGEGADAPVLGLVIPEGTQAEDHFATFWAIHCHRGGSSKKESRKLWDAYFAKPPAMRYSEAQVIAARQRYADATDARYYNLTEVWLRQEKFETFVGSSTQQAASSPPVKLIPGVNCPPVLGPVYQ